MSTGIPALWMRGGTSKGLFFLADDLPAEPARRDALLLRAIGSPDPYGRHTDGLGGATSSTSKVVLVSRSARPGRDVDYLFGAVSIGEPLIDWSGNCGNLASAVGPFALHAGLVAPVEGVTRVRIWQANIGQCIDALVPVKDGRVLEEGDFMEDGVPFPSAEIRLEYLEPEAGPGAVPLLPTGRVRDLLEVPGIGSVAATLITAGNPTVFVRADALGLDPHALPAAIDGDAALLERLERVRAAGAVAMGLAPSAHDATRSRPATPKLAWVAPPADTRVSTGAALAGDRVDVLARILSMGRLHHAFTGTGSIALAAAAALPGSVVREVARPRARGEPLRIGHVSGTLSVGALLEEGPGGWRMTRALMSRSARRLMSGTVHLPG